MSSWTGIPELKESYHKLGAARFLTMMAGVLGWIGLGAWLSITTPGWPDAYGSTCHGRGCLLDDLWYSPGLLSGSWHEWALFAWLWSMPTLVAGTLVYALLMRRGIFANSDSE